MPTYSYRCTECGTAFDIQQAFTDDSLTVCPTLRRQAAQAVLSAVGVSFTGSGFYRNDSRPAARRRGAKASSREHASREHLGRESTPAATSDRPPRRPRPRKTPARKGVTVFKGFREFILRGNVIDLAVAVVIGAAFTAIVNGLVDGDLQPAHRADLQRRRPRTAPGSRCATPPGPTTTIVLSWGLVISALIQFLLVAAVVYFALIVPMNYLKKVSLQEEGRGEQPAETPLTETDCSLRSAICWQRSSPAQARAKSAQ